MGLENQGLWDGYRLEIVGIDINRIALARAEQGIYTSEELMALPPLMRDKYFKPVGVSKSKFVIDNHLRSLVRFQYCNLLDEVSLSKLGIFDAVFSFETFPKFSVSAGNKAVKYIINNCMAPYGFWISDAMLQVKDRFNAYDIFYRFDPKFQNSFCSDGRHLYGAKNFYQRKSQGVILLGEYIGCESLIPVEDKLEEHLYPDSIRGLKVTDDLRNAMRQLWRKYTSQLSEEDKKKITFKNGSDFFKLFVAGKNPVLQKTARGCFEVVEKPVYLVGEVLQDGVQCRILVERRKSIVVDDLVSAILASTENEASRAKVFLQMFFELFGQQPQYAHRAPGRDNWQGEHVDYPPGQFRYNSPGHLYSIGGAIQNNFMVAMRVNDSRAVHLAHLDAKEWFEFNLDELEKLQEIAVQERKDESENKITPKNCRIPVWARHTLGVLNQARQRNYLLQGMDMLLTSNVPVGGGLSNSAANCGGVVRVLNDAYELHLSLFDQALLAQAGEHDAFVGGSCGLLDQLLSLASKEGYLTMIDYGAIVSDPDNAVMHFKSNLPVTLQRVLIHTQVPHDLQTTEYRDRGRELDIIFKLLSELLKKDIGSTSLTLRDLNELIQRLDPSVLWVDLRAAGVENIISAEEKVRQNNLSLSLEQISQIVGNAATNYVVSYLKENPNDFIKHKNKEIKASFALLLRRMRHQLTSSLRTPLSGQAAEAGKVQAFGELINGEGRSLRRSGDMDITGENGAQDALLDIGFEIANSLGLEDIFGRMEGGGGGGFVGFFVDRSDEGFYQSWLEGVKQKYARWAKETLGRDIIPIVIEPRLAAGAESIAMPSSLSGASLLENSGLSKNPATLGGLSISNLATINSDIVLEKDNLMRNCLIKVISQLLDRPVEDIAALFIKLGLTTEDIQGMEINLAGAQKIIRSDPGLRRIASRIYIFKVGEHLYHATTEKTAETSLILKLEAEDNDRVGYARYKSVNDKKAGLVLAELSRETRQGLLAYKLRFQEGVESWLRSGSSGNFSFLSDNDPRILQWLADNLSESRISHQALLEDEAGVYWILKRFQPVKNKNRPRYERLAYLLSQGKANLAEIRLIKADDVKGLNFLDRARISEYYLTRLVVSSNITGLPHLDPARAFAGIFVASILIRKPDQHILNIAYAAGTPVSVDQDMAFNYQFFPNTKAGFDRFGLDFLIHSIVKTFEVFTTFPMNKGVNYSPSFFNNDLVRCLMAGGDYGLLAAQMLNDENIEKAIREFKVVENVRELAAAAGYHGDELEQVVLFITENRQRLGSDTSVVWQLLTNRNGDFDKLDITGL